MLRRYLTQSSTAGALKIKSMRAQESFKWTTINDPGADEIFEILIGENPFRVKMFHEKYLQPDSLLEKKLNPPL